MTGKITTCTPRRGWLVLMALLLGLPALRAQDTLKISELYPTDTAMTATRQGSSLPPISVGLSSGTHAFVGIDATANLLPRFNVRLGYNLMQFTLDDFRLQGSYFGFSDQVFLLDVNTNLSTLGLLADYALNPAENLRVMAGAMVSLNNRIEVDGRFQNSIFINDFELQPERIGAVGGTYRTKLPVFPYLGVALGRAIPKRRLGLSLEVGAYLRGKPEVTLRSSGLLADNEHNGPIISENLSNLSLPLSWHPNFSLRLSYRLDPPPPPAPTPTPGSEIEPAESEPEMPMERPEDLAVAEETTAPVKPEVSVADSYPYIIFNGKVLDADTKQPLEYVYVDVYKELPGKNRELIRTGRFPGGLFTVGMEHGLNYVFVFIHRDYGEQERTFQLPQSFSERIKDQNFYLESN